MTPPKDGDALEGLLAKYDVKGIICVDAAAPPKHCDAIGGALPLVSLEQPEGLRPAAGTVSFMELLEHCPPRGSAPSATETSLLGVYGGTALSQDAARTLGQDAASKLGTGVNDRVCCSVTLMHAFGIASSVSSALYSGAAVVLPAVGGIRGCGDPAQRAAVTVEVLAETSATQLFGDTHTLKAMLAAEKTAAVSAPPLALRTGVIKIGSGNDFLDGVREAPAPKGGGEPMPLEYAGIALHAFGKAAK